MYQRSPLPSSLIDSLRGTVLSIYRKEFRGKKGLPTVVFSSSLLGNEKQSVCIKVELPSGRLVEIPLDGNFSDTRAIKRIITGKLKEARQTSDG